MIAQVTGYKVGTYQFDIGNAHMYDRHIDKLSEQIKKNTYKPPKLWINPSVTSFYDFTIDDFELIDYQHGGKIDFEIAI